VLDAQTLLVRARADYYDALSEYQIAWRDSRDPWASPTFRGRQKPVTIDIQEVTYAGIYQEDDDVRCRPCRMTREKTEELVKELVKKGEMSEKEGKQLVNDLMEKSKKMTREIETKTEEMVTSTSRGSTYPPQGTGRTQGTR